MHYHLINVPRKSKKEVIFRNGCTSGNDIFRDVLAAALVHLLSYGGGPVHAAATGPFYTFRETLLRIGFSEAKSNEPN